MHADRPRRRSTCWLTVAIGLFAAKRVKNTADYAVAGRSLPLRSIIATTFATWFGAETVLGIPARFVSGGFNAWSRTRSALDVPDPGRPVLRRPAVPDDPDDPRRLLPPALRPHHRGGLFADHHPELPGLGGGAGHGARPGLQRAVGGRDPRAGGHGDRHDRRPGLHAVRRHVVGGPHRLRPDDRDRHRADRHRRVCRRPGRRGRQGDRLAASDDMFHFLPEAGLQGRGPSSSRPPSP